jgi:ADP-ribosylglycohydrolase
MIGSLLGDIVGSRFEFISTQEREAKLFHSACSWTDDSVCTYAVALACEKIIADNIVDEEEIEQLFFKQFKKAVKAHPMAGYGKKFFAWSQNKHYSPADSAANGCLMRVSPLVMYFNDLEIIQQLGKICTQTSHNHPDSFKNVAALLEIMFYLKTNAKGDVSTLKTEVVNICAKHEINVESMETYHKLAGYWVLAKDTLPRAIAAYLDTPDFDTTFRNIIYLGSDTDTTATIAGALSEFTYGIEPQHLDEFYRYYDHKSFEMLKQICHPYLTQQDLSLKLYGEEGFAKIKELYNYNATDPTASYDPLEIPSDEQYYKVMPTPTLKERLLKLFNFD